MLKLELPLDPVVLRENARMLDRIAEAVSGPMLLGIHDTMPSTKDARESGLIGEPETIPEPKPEVDTVPTPQPTADVMPEPQPEADTTPTVDNRGMKWDERIHASSKAINVDGTWRNKRGVDKDLLAQVEAELLGEEAPETDAPAATPSPQPSTPTPTPAPQPMDAKEWTFGALAAEITMKQINPVAVLTAVQNVGLASYELLAARPDLVPQVAAELGL